MIYPLDSLEAENPSNAGGKASALCRLIRAGFQVPEGLVVTSREDARAGLAEHLQRLESRGGAPLMFAVRSSGFSEDSADASFAGQYESILGVRGIENIARAIDRCFASFSNARSAAYRQGRGSDTPGGTVIVQRLIAAEAAGVAFTVDPVKGTSDCVVMESNFGLGESVVGGHVVPDGFSVSKSTGEIVDRRIGEKQKQSLLESGGTRLVDIPENLQKTPSLDDDAIRAVAVLARRVEEYFGKPMDIEWAWEKGQVWLLQARPITTLRAARRATAPPAGWIPELNTQIDSRFPLYSNGNVSEILPGCITPLTYSTFSASVERAFRDTFESLGSMKDVGKAPVVVGFFFNRLYINVSYFMIAADNSLGASRDSVHEELIGPVTQRHPAFTAADLLPWRLLRGLGIVGRFLKLQGKLESDIAACRANYDRERHLFEVKPPATWTNDELAPWIEFNERSLDPARVHIRASQCASSSFATLKALTKRWLGDETGALASTLVTGIGTIASANPAAALYELSRLVVDEPSLAAMFAAQSDDERILDRVYSANDRASRRFSDALDMFLENFGHRGYREADLRCPCWRERSSDVIAHIRQHIAPGSTSPDAIAERQQKLSSEARATVLAKLKGARRSFFISILDGARKHIAAREQMKDLLLLYLDLTRRVIAETQIRLKNVLQSPDDIHFLLDREVGEVLRGALNGHQVSEIVTRRRSDFAFSLTVSVPRIQDGGARYLSEPEALGSGQLTGIPVSPGKVEGRARVVLNPSDAVLDPGDILIAPVTDVAWTPLFLRAGGLVVEVGGPLSHGSIVAREYGIPAVTAVGDATRRIRNGDRVHVDGDRGTVTILPA